MQRCNLSADTTPTALKLSQELLTTERMFYSEFIGVQDAMQIPRQC